MYIQEGNRVSKTTYNATQYSSMLQYLSDSHKPHKNKINAGLFH